MSDIATYNVTVSSQDETFGVDTDNDEQFPVTLDSAIVTGVTSWNGQTGDITYTPPVTSVNGETGAVYLNASEVGAISSSSLVTSISSSSTNSQVPSARCIYNLIGNVETLLASI